MSRLSHNGAAWGARRRPSAVAAGILLLILAGMAWGQRTERSGLWREWSSLQAEWTAERAVYFEDRAFNARLRAARPAPRPRPAEPEVLREEAP